MATLQLDGVRKSFGHVDVIHDMTLQVHDGELIVFVGPSGCGKSTMLRMIAGLESLSAGQIHIGERRIDTLPPKDRGIAMVFQSYALYPHKDVRGNLGFALKHAGVDRAEIDRRVDEASAILGLSDMMTRKPRELSGGQRQRVAIGRAIVREPDVFLFDEPLSNLDAALRVHMRVEILKLHQRLRNTMVYVTHDQVEAMTLADRIVVFREGRVEQIGAPLELYRTPINTFVARFIGSPSMNLLDAHARDGIVSLHGEALCRVPVVDGPLQVGVRPEHLVATGNRTTPAGEPLIALPEGRVQVFEHLGGESYAHVLLDGGQELVAKLDGEFDLAVDQSIVLSLPSTKLHLFEPNGARIAIDPV